MVKMIKKINREIILNRKSEVKEITSKEKTEKKEFTEVIKKELQKIIIFAIEENKELFEKEYNDAISKITEMSGDFEIKVNMKHNGLNKDIRETQDFVSNILKIHKNQIYHCTKFIFGNKHTYPAIILRKKELFDKTIIDVIKEIFSEADCTFLELDEEHTMINFYEISFVLKFQYDFKEKEKIIDKLKGFVGIRK